MGRRTARDPGRVKTPQSDYSSYLREMSLMGLLRQTHGSYLKDVFVDEMYEAGELYSERKSHMIDTVVMIHAEIKAKAERGGEWE